MLPQKIFGFCGRGEEVLEKFEKLEENNIDGELCVVAAIAGCCTFEARYESGNCLVELIELNKRRNIDTIATIQFILT